jgi:hypothetical protein
MKGNIDFIIPLCISVLLTAGVTGCSSFPPSTIYHDPVVPWEKQALLLVDDSSKICGFDDNISSRPAIQSGQIGVIPAGRHTIHVIVDDGKYSTPCPGVALSYDFRPGERYVVLSGGAASVKILTLDEYDAEWEMSGPFRNSPTKIREQYFRELVLDKFEETVAALGGNRS